MQFNLSLLDLIIFDLDGTLIDTVPDVRLALNKTLSLFGEKQINRVEIYDLIGHGAYAMMEGALLKVGVKLAPSDIKKAVISYLDFYKENPVIETKIYPNVRQVLSELKNNNLKLAICTNKPSIMTTLVLEQLELRHFFDIISCGDEVAYPKPDGRHLLTMLEKMQISVEKAVMIGDSDVDHAAAKNADMAFIGVSYGYSNEKLMVDRIIDNFIELPNELRASVEDLCSD